jgi:uncharacterized membrane protein YfcA
MKKSRNGFYNKINPIWYWVLWVITFYIVWTIIVVQGEHWLTVGQNWEIAFAMLIGSFAAGSTPMGGGTVGFPVLVMLMDMPAQVGRDFSFAIQAIGMTSASILILCRKQLVDTRLLCGAVCGAIVGTPIGIYIISPLVDELLIKLLFSTLWAGFGILHLMRFREISSRVQVDTIRAFKWRVGFWASVFSTSTVCGVTGVGVDMIIYSVLILLFRGDLKVAIPTSVIIMAFTSAVGILIKISDAGIEEDVFNLWLAAAPVVILGAPLGVVVVDLVGRNKTLFSVAMLCVGQYVWVCVREYTNIGVTGLLMSLTAVFVVIYLLEALRKIGLKLTHKHGTDSNELLPMKAEQVV